MKKNKALYFLAIIPPDEIEQEIYVLKKMCWEKFESKRALNSPSHITLVPPFWLQESEYIQFYRELSDLLSQQKKFNVELDGFDFFPPKVVFVDVVKNEQLDDLYFLLKSFLKTKSLEIRFRPSLHAHATIAFKDLRKAMFYRAKEYFQHQAFQAKFPVDKLVILKHQGGKWLPNDYCHFMHQPSN